MRSAGAGGFSFARGPFGGCRAGTPAGVRAPLGCGSGGVASLNHRLHAGMPPASCGAESGIMRGHLWDHAWMSPASCWVPLGLCGAAFGIMLSGVRGHAGLPLGSAGPPRRAYSPDKFLRGILTAEGMRLTGEPRKVREKGPCPVLRAKRAPWWRFHSRF